MTAIDSARARLQTEEGFRPRLYRDTRGYQTIGYGFNVDAGVSQRVAAATLAEQLQELQETLSTYSWYAGLDPIRQGVCLDIAFNEGLHGLLRFPHMIAALAAKDWLAAQNECRVEDPKLSSRYAELGEIILTGVA